MNSEVASGRKKHQRANLVDGFLISTSVKFILRLSSPSLTFIHSARRYPFLFTSDLKGNYKFNTNSAGSE